MSRNPLIEAIHEARYTLETSAPEEYAACRRNLEALVEQALRQVNSSAPISTILNALYDDYREFRRSKRRQEWPKL